MEEFGPPPALIRIDPSVAIVGPGPAHAGHDRGVARLSPCGEQPKTTAVLRGLIKIWPL